jgi:hypothetical protein
MTRMLDCLVSYFGLDEDERPAYRRYFCYHVLAGPGPTATAGVAITATLAVHDDRESCTSCQNFHAVQTGGPEAALAAAVRYLDAYHQQDHLRKVQSDIRGLGVGAWSGDHAPAPNTVSPTETRFRVSGGRGVPTLKG